MQDGERRSETETAWHYYLSLHHSLEYMTSHSLCKMAGLALLSLPLLWRAKPSLTAVERGLLVSFVAARRTSNQHVIERAEGHCGSHLRGHKQVKSRCMKEMEEEEDRKSRRSLR